jgi:AmiR/NasT family two-component response regulator
VPFQLLKVNEHMSDAETSRSAKPNILIVDDDRLILATLGMGLRDAGYEVREASSGAEALRFCAEQPPDLVMLDARMPGLSGMDVAAELFLKNIPFIFLSAYGDHAIVKQAVEQGAYSYLVKPLDVPQIVPVIEAALVRSAELKQLKLTEQNLNVALSRGRATSVAIGLIMERYRLTADEAFEVLRQYARSQRRRLDEVAAQMVSAAEEINIPPKIVGLARKAPDKSQN